MSSVSISSRSPKRSASSCSFVRPDPARTVPVTRQPLFRNCSAIASPRPREAATSRIEGVLAFDTVDCMGFTFAKVRHATTIGAHHPMHQTHQIQSIVALNAMPRARCRMLSGWKTST
jgi:hypothetical protein